jgi:V8-like Glu-specific endopeptidase
MFLPYAPRAVVASITVGLTLAACSAVEPTEEATGTDESRIVGGKVNTGDPAVFQLKTVTPLQGGSTSIGSCTATLVSPTVLLTAAHCIEGAGAATTAWVNNTTTPSTALPSQATGWKKISTMQMHENYPQRFANLGYDCAVLVLEDPITDITPKTYRKAPLPASAVGTTARIVGYGNTNGAAGTGSGTKRELATRIKEVRDGVLTIGSRGAVSCQGDSGGPAFLSEGGEEVIAGISSYGDVGCVENGSYARTELCAPFFDQFVHQACTPDCAAKQCGSDGCGGSCGSCGAGETCVAGTCSPGSPNPNDPPPPPPLSCLESEPNNTLDATRASQFCADGSARGTLANSSDNDFFVIEIPPNSIYDIRIVTGQPNVRLSVIKETGDSFVGWDGGSARRVSYATSTGGRYFAKVYNSVAPSGPEAYELRAAVTPR